MQGAHLQLDLLLFFFFKARKLSSETSSVEVISPNRVLVKDNRQDDKKYFILVKEARVPSEILNNKSLILQINGAGASRATQALDHTSQVMFIF